MLFLLAALAGLGWAVKWRLDSQVAGGGGPRGGAGPAPVEVAEVERGEIKLRRTFSGTLEPFAEFVVASNVGGRIERLNVDLADRVEKNQVVAELDDSEYEQAVKQAEADVAVATANIKQATSALVIAERELERVQSLRSDGVASEAQLDTAKANVFAKEADLAVATAQAQRATAVLNAAKIRKEYTQVKATWGKEKPADRDSLADGSDAATPPLTSPPPEEFGGVPRDEAPESKSATNAADADRYRYRYVAERFVDEGDTVSANTPMLSIVRLNPIKGVVFTTEKDYSQLSPGQSVSLTTDAYPGRTFAGRIVRIAPVFRQSSRQARVELAIENDSLELKPGMFVRAEIVLATEADAVIVPVDALTTRDKQAGVFIVNEADNTVTWRPITVGIREGERVQVIGEGVEGRVITLGQQLIGDGSEITIPADEEAAAKAKTNAANSGATNDDDRTHKDGPTKSSSTNAKQGGRR